MGPYTAREEQHSEEKRKHGSPLHVLPASQRHAPAPHGAREPSGPGQGTSNGGQALPNPALGWRAYDLPVPASLCAGAGSQAYLPSPSPGAELRDSEGRGRERAGGTGVPSFPDGAKPTAAPLKAAPPPGSFQSNACVLKLFSPTGNPRCLLWDKGDSAALCHGTGLSSHLM